MVTARRTLPSSLAETWKRRKSACRVVRPLPGGFKVLPDGGGQARATHRADFAHTGFLVRCRRFLSVANSVGRLGRRDSASHSSMLIASCSAFSALANSNWIASWRSSETASEKQQE